MIGSSAGVAPIDSSKILRVERLTPDRRDDFLRLFDRLRGVAGDCGFEAARCYCHYYHLATAIAWDSLDAHANRVAMSARIEVGEMEGFLAYRDGDAIAWLNAQPLHKLSHSTSRLAIPAIERDVPSHEAAAVVCLVVDPSCEQHKVGQTLLAAALESFKERGIRIVDAFPRKGRRNSPSRQPDHASLSLFLEAGFAVMREEAEFMVVRKQWEQRDRP